MKILLNKSKGVLGLILSLFMLISAVPASAEGNNVERIAGKTRFETSVEISKDMYPNGADVVIIASGSNTIDSVTAGPLAIEEDVPILLVGRDIPGAVANEIDRLNPSKAIIVGGDGSVSNQVARDLGINNTIRLSGPTRYETSVEIAKYLYNNHGYTDAAIVNAGEPLEALLVTARAAEDKMPILLSASDNLPTALEGYLYDTSAENVHIMSSERSILPQVAEYLASMEYEVMGRILSDDIYQSSWNAMYGVYYDPRTDGPDFDSAVLVTSDQEKMSDALTAAPFAYKINAPIVLTDGRDIEENLREFLVTEAVENYYAIGGSGTISSSLLDDLASSVRFNPYPYYEENNLANFENFMKIYIGMIPDQAVEILGDPTNISEDGIGGSTYTWESRYGEVIKAVFLGEDLSMKSYYNLPDGVEADISSIDEWDLMGFKEGKTYDDIASYIGENPSTMTMHPNGLTTVTWDQMAEDNSLIASIDIVTDYKGNVLTLSGYGNLVRGEDKNIFLTSEDLHMIDLSYTYMDIVGFLGCYPHNTNINERGQIMAVWYSDSGETLMVVLGEQITSFDFAIRELTFGSEF